jgi:hypothetical protein
MDATSYHDLKSSLRQLYLDDRGPWLVGFSSGKDSSMPASLGQAKSSMISRRKATSSPG